MFLCDTHVVPSVYNITNSVRHLYSASVHLGSVADGQEVWLSVATGGDREACSKWDRRSFLGAVLRYDLLYDLGVS